MFAGSRIGGGVSPTKTMSAPEYSALCRKKGKVGIVYGDGPKMKLKRTTSERCAGSDMGCSVAERREENGEEEKLKV